MSDAPAPRLEARRPSPEALRVLSARSAALLVVASMIGTGVFTTTGFLIRDIGSSPAVLIAWALSGLAALGGALAYAELSVSLPRGGGEYALISSIYGRGAGFVAGFVSVVVGFCAPIASSSIAFAAYLDTSRYGVPEPVAAALLVLVSSGVHSLEVKRASALQDWVTYAKLLFLILFVGAGLALGDPAMLTSPTRVPLGAALVSPALAVGLVYISYAYSGWNAVAYVAGEVREPSRNIPRAIVWGTSGVIAIYLATNVVYFLAAPPEALAGHVDIAKIAATHLLGEGAGILVSWVIAAGLVSSVGALVMSGARIYEELGRDYPRLSVFARRSPDTAARAPVIVQAVITLAMIASASFDALLTYAGFTLSLTAALTVAGVFVLRARAPNAQRAYASPGHPWTTVAFLALTAWMVVHTLVEAPVVTLAGGATLVVGALLYLWARGGAQPSVEP